LEPANILRNQQVAGSIPAGGSSLFNNFKAARINIDSNRLYFLSVFESSYPPHFRSSYGQFFPRGVDIVAINDSIAQVHRRDPVPHSRQITGHERVRLGG
jgi:hypothetical protein